MILVVGATGRVGGAVLDCLKGIAPLRPSYATTAPTGSGADWVRLDLLDPSSFSAALNCVNAIFLMRPPKIAKAKLLEPFLKAARREGIKRLVFLSVKGAENNPILPHHGMERLIEQMGFDWTHIRPSDFMQNLETEHLDAIINRGVISVPAGSGKSAFIDVADVGAVIALTLLTPGHGGKGYTLTGPQALDFYEIARILSAVMGRTIAYRPSSLLRFIAERRTQNKPLVLRLVMAALYTFQRLGLAAGMTETVQQLLGRPATGFQVYAKRRFGESRLTSR